MHIDEMVSRALLGVTRSYAVSLSFTAGGFLQVETGFSLTLHDGRTLIMSVKDLSVETESVPVELHDLIGAVTKRILVNEEHGSLLVEFEDGSRLDVPAHPDFEAWTLAWRGGKMMISMPGAGIGIWGAAERSSQDDASASS